MLQRGDRDYARYLPTYNVRTARSPEIRALCSTEAAVAGVVGWLRDEGRSFAMRSGGHSFEGYSESSDVVVDVRGLASVRFDATTGQVTAGAGATLGAVYAALPSAGVSFSAGTCPTVGIAGHALGGGLGMVSRAFGLASDNLTSVTLIDARGKRLVVDAGNHPDLFWACRGGGGGSFGVATSLTFKAHPVGKITVFGVDWSLENRRTAAALIDAWQRWAPRADRRISALLRIGKLDKSRLRLRCFGQTLGLAEDLRREIANLTSIAAPDKSPSLITMSSYDAVRYFAGKDNDQGVYFTKEKSDFAHQLSAEAIGTMIAEIMTLPAARVVIILYPLGGAVGQIAPEATAFPHRSASLLLHYFTLWDSPSATAIRLRDIRKVAAAMRPHLPGWGYVNYCDADLVDWPTAYWAGNLQRLVGIKRSCDPSNLFHYPQSVPLGYPMSEELGRCEQ